MDARAVQAAIAAFEQAKSLSPNVADQWSAAIKAAARFIELKAKQRLDEVSREFDALAEECEVTEVLYSDLQERAVLMEGALRKILALDPTNIYYAHAAAIARAALSAQSVAADGA